MWNIAHRGARAFAPENTLESFAKACEFNCRMIELDVHFSKDGELVVHHDDEITRCTNVGREFPNRATYYVSEFTYDQLSSLDAGSWFVEQLILAPHLRQPYLQSLTSEEIDCFVTPNERTRYASGEVKIPRLQEVLELARDRRMLVNVELKTLPRMYPGLAQSVVELVDSMGMAESFLISSFDHEQLLEVRRLNDMIATGVLTSDRLARPGDYLQMLDADAYHPGCVGDVDSIGFNSCSGELELTGIQSVRALGRAVNVWTCNDQNTMRKLVSAGVTGLITDYLNRAQTAMSGN